MAQAAMLPIISGATLFLYYKHMRKSLHATPWMIALLWAAFLFITAFVVPSLYAELMKLFA